MVSIGFLLVGYLCGSLPFAFWVTRWRKGVDVREAGSGHASATNTIRQAGGWAGVLVAVLDISKGFIPTYLALNYAEAGWVVPFTAALAVIGHCWPVFAGFRGGMGLATSGGAIMAISPMGFVVGLGVLIALVLIISHAARASAISGFAIPAVLYLIGLRGAVIWASIAIGLVISLRFRIDWNRKYRELWLDREIESDP